MKVSDRTWEQLEAIPDRGPRRLHRLRGVHRPGARGRRRRRRLCARLCLPRDRRRRSPRRGRRPRRPARRDRPLPPPRRAQARARPPRRSDPRGRPCAASRADRRRAARARPPARYRPPAGLMLRRPILAAADSAPVRGFVDRYGMRLGAQRFVAGETLDQAVAVLRRLNEQGLQHEHDAPRRARPRPRRGRAGDRDLRGGAPADRRRAARRRTSSVKPTHLGALVDKELVYANIERLVAEAGRLGNFVRIDMEDTPFVDLTLGIVPPPARGGARQRRHRSPGLPLPDARTTSSRCCR